MFSTTTIESSTSRPSATTKPAIEIWLSEKPRKYSADEADRQRQRNRDHDDARGAQAERQQRDRDQRDRDPEVVVSRSSRCATFSDWSKPSSSWMRLGSCVSKRFGGGEDALADVEDVVAVLLVRRDEHGALAVEAADVDVLLRVPAHLGDVAHAHAAAVGDGDDGVAHLIERSRSCPKS